MRIEGALDAELEAALRAASSSVQSIERPPADELQLARRAQRDLPALEAALRGLGYYRGRAAVVVEPAAAAPLPPAAPDAPPDAAAPAEPRAVVRFTVEPGPRYRFDRRSVEILGEAHGFVPPKPGKLGLERDEPAIAQRVLDAEAELVRSAQRNGHAFARAGPREVVVDHDRQTMDVVLRLEPGPSFQLGPIRFRGAEGISERYLARLLTAREGSRFDLDELERGRDRLAESGLFSSVRLVVADAPDPSGRLPITFVTVQRRHRSIGGGIGYLTDEGPNLRVFWEHRNLFGAGERLRTDLAASPIRQSAEAQLRKPEVGARRQSLIVNGALLSERLDAYDARSAKVSGGVERRFAAGLEGSLGLAYRFADIEDRGRAERFGLLSAPARLSWDRSDNLFDPTRGGRVAVELAPHADTLGAGTRFLKGRLVATAYLPIRKQPRLVLAGRSAIGVIGGADREAVPADERFYAGGGGSVRGVPFQKAGPLDRHDDPVGGRSFLEFSTELRLAITETIGVVGFLDTGSAYPESLPDPAAGLRWGAGIGLRYATPVGPLRLDVGIPLDRRGVDDLFQLYLSLGQAF